MKKSTIGLITALRSKLFEFPQIVNSLEKKEVFFIDKLFIWIKEIEEILTTYNVSAVSEISGLRSKIDAAKYSDSKNISTKKAQLKIASEVLYDLQHTVFNVLNPLELKVEEYRELIRQLLAIVSQTQEIKYNPDVPFDSLVNEVWSFIISNEQLKAGAIKLKTYLIFNDIYMLIAEEINIVA